MAILIPNMEMPETCSDCPLEYDSFMCRLTGTNFFDKAKEVYADFTKERMPDCPLIDANELSEMFDIACAEACKPHKEPLEVYDTEEYLTELGRKYGGE